jgi:adenylate kinase
MEPHTIFFIGKPGCGKGDQARMLSEKTGWKILTAGGEFRVMTTENTPVGRKVKQVNDVGLLQPHWLAEYLFLKNLFSLSENEGVIFDGFARKVPEAELVIESLQWINRPFSVLYLKVSDEEMKHRLELRKGIEDRVDDNVVDERLKEYCEYTEPVVEMFRKKGMLIEINGERAREPIAEDIQKVFNIPSTG